MENNWTRRKYNPQQNQIGTGRIEKFANKKQENNYDIQEKNLVKRQKITIKGKSYENGNGYLVNPTN